MRTVRLTKPQHGIFLGDVYRPPQIIVTGTIVIAMDHIWHDSTGMGWRICFWDGQCIMLRMHKLEFGYAKPQPLVEEL